MSLQSLPLDLLEKILSHCSSVDAAKMLRLNQHLMNEITKILNTSNWIVKTVVESRFSIDAPAEVDPKSPLMLEVSRMYQSFVDSGSKDPRREVEKWFDKAYPASIELSSICKATLNEFGFLQILGVYDRRLSLINSYPSYDKRNMSAGAGIAGFPNCIYQFKGEWIIKSTNRKLRNEPEIIAAETSDVVSRSPFINRTINLYHVEENEDAEDAEDEDEDDDDEDEDEDPDASWIKGKISATIPSNIISPYQLIVTDVSSPCTVTVTATALSLNNGLGTEISYVPPREVVNLSTMEVFGPFPAPAPAGEPAEGLVDCLGSYVASEDWIDGVRVFKQKEGSNALWAAEGRWNLGSMIESRPMEVYAYSANNAPSLCPANPGAGLLLAWDSSNWPNLNQTREWLELNVVVNCETHHDLSPIHLRK